MPPPMQTPPRAPGSTIGGTIGGPLFSHFTPTTVAYPDEDMSRLHLEDNPHTPTSTKFIHSVVRTFDVLLAGPAGRKWYERGVACSRAADLCGILQSRLGFPIPEVLYQGQLFTEKLFRTVPNELKLELTASAQPPPQYAGAASNAPAKREVTLLVEEAPTRLTVECYSVNDLMQKLNNAGVSGDVFLRNVTGTGEEILQPVTNLESIKYEQPLRIHRREGAATHQGASSSRAYSRSNAREIPKTPVPDRDAISVQHVVVETGNLLLQSEVVNQADDAAIAKATATIAQQFKQMYTTTSTANSGRVPSDEEMVYLRRLVREYLLPLESAAQAATPSGVTGGNSVFKSVTFGVSGAFPSATTQFATNAVSVAPPPRPEEGKSIVVIVHAVAGNDIDLRCTLGYENEHGKILVINMDEFYVNEWVALGKTSPTSLFVSFQPDVLRAGVRYLLDVTAFSTEQPGVKVGTSQVELVVHPAGSRAEPNDFGGPSTLTHTRGGAASLEPAYAPAVPPAARSLEGSHEEVDDGYFQSQVRAFLENKVLPLYSLSTNPRFSEDTFIDMVEKACDDFWYADPNQELTEAHKKTLLSRVKEVLLK